MYLLKRQKVLTAGIAIAFTVGLFSIIVGNSADEPGGESNPLVPKSYVDSKIADLTKLLDASNQKIEALSKNGPGTVSVQKYEVIEVKQGQSVICKESAELILRSGKAKAISSEAGGLADITSDEGKDLKTGESIPANHLLIIPRDDGRGIKVTSTSAWVMIKGKYDIR